MAVTYTLGKNYTVEGLAGASELTVTKEGERVDVTTRANAKPFKLSVAGLQATTIECSVFAESTTSFTIGLTYDLTLNDIEYADLVCLNATREESGAGVITYKLKFRPGYPSDSDQQAEIGPGTYRA